MPPVVGTREQILERIVALLGTVPGIRNAVRDRAQFADVAGSATDAEVFPAAVLLDGGEELMQTIVPQKSVLMPAAIFRMRPEIYVLLRQRDDATNLTLDGQPAPVGPELTAWRDAVLAALINDPTLLDLLTTSGQIVYRGCQTDMASGRTLIGQLQLYIDFHYVWLPPRGQ